MRRIGWAGILLLGLWAVSACRAPQKMDRESGIDPTTLIWYEHPADKWDNAFPVGNGRLGAMVFGGTDQERI